MHEASQESDVQEEEYCSYFLDSHAKLSVKKLHKLSTYSMAFFVIVNLSLVLQLEIQTTLRLSPCVTPGDSMSRKVTITHSRTITFSWSRKVLNTADIFDTKIWKPWLAQHWPTDDIRLSAVMFVFLFFFSCKCLIKLTSTNLLSTIPYQSFLTNSCKVIVRLTFVY